MSNAIATEPGDGAPALTYWLVLATLAASLLCLGLANIPLGAVPVRLADNLASHKVDLGIFGFGLLAVAALEFVFLKGSI